MNGYQLQLLTKSPVLRGRALFTGDFAGFDGHFPEAPMLPGFMHVQAALDLLQLAGIEGQPGRVEGAKFMRPVFPGQAVFLEAAAAGPGQYEITLSGPEPEMVCSRFHLALAGPES